MSDEIRTSSNRARNPRTQLRELLVMLSIGVPGLACILWGARQIESAHGATCLGVALLAAGAALFIATGYYHYKKDYAPRGRRSGLVAFLFATLVPGFIGVIAARLIAGR
jgi:hypothetical protein